MKKKLNKLTVVALFFIIIGSIFYLKAKTEFTKIENKVLDDNLKITITYTKREQLEEVLNTNQIFFDEIVSEISENEYTKSLSYINIPFDYPNTDIEVYSGKQSSIEDKSINDELREKFEYLSNELKFNVITIIPDSSGELVYSFYQSNCLDNTYIGITCSPVEQSINNESHLSVAFTKNTSVRTTGFYKIINTNSSNYWYYQYSRDTQTYGFWDRLYDIVMGNLN